MDFEGKLTISQFMQRKKLKQPLHNLLNVLELYIKEIGMTIPRYLGSIRNLCSASKKNKRGNSSSSYILSSHCQSSAFHQKNTPDPPIHSPDYHGTLSSFNIPVRRSYELNTNEINPRKRFSFIRPNSIQRPSHMSIQHNTTPDSPKNYSYSTEEEVILKSKIYSTIDISEQNSRKKEGMRQASSYL